MIDFIQPYWWNEKAGSLPAQAMEKAEQLFMMVCNGGGGASVSRDKGTSAPNVIPTDLTNPALSSTSELASSSLPSLIDPSTASATTTTATCEASPTTPGGGSIRRDALDNGISTLSSAAKPRIKAGTCILKDFGRTAKTPTLKNLSISGSYSTNKAAELEAEAGLLSQQQQPGRLQSEEEISTLQHQKQQQYQHQFDELEEPLTRDIYGETESTVTHEVGEEVLHPSQSPPSSPQRQSLTLAELTERFDKRKQVIQEAQTANNSHIPGGKLVVETNEIEEENELLDTLGEIDVSVDATGGGGDGLPLQSVFQRIKPLNTSSGSDHTAAPTSEENEKLSTSCEPALTNWNGEFKG